VGIRHDVTSTARITNKVQVQASLIMADRNDALLEQVINRLSLEPGVSAVSWKAVENGAV
jgi:hypothetical protein